MNHQYTDTVDRVMERAHYGQSFSNNCQNLTLLGPDHTYITTRKLAGKQKSTVMMVTTNKDLPSVPWHISAGNHQ